MRDVSGNIIPSTSTASSSSSITIKPPVMVNGIPSLDGFSEKGTELGKLDTMLWEYTQGYTQNIQSAQNSGGLLNNSQLIGALNTITGPIPQLSVALQVAGKLKSVIDNAFGVGSTVGMFADSIFSGDLIGAVKSLFNGRTWRYDQYQLATIYSYHILGKDIGDTTHASDELVVEACKYFIDRLGVFINGARTLYAFINPLNNGIRTGRQGSAMEYMILVNENPFITIDANRVNAAYQVVKTYMPDVDIPSNWRGIIGVYDRELVSLAQQGYNNYYGNLAALKQQAASGDTSNLNSSSNTLTSNSFLYVIIAIVVIIIIIIIIAR